MSNIDNYGVVSYSEEQISKSVLILHPKVIERYNITMDDFHSAFEIGSNFTQLQNPVIDEHGNKYHDSEGLYMAQRFTCQQVKQLISFCSQGHGLSKKVAYLYEDQMDKDDSNRIEYMRKTIAQKFDRNPELKQQLIETGTRDIIEFTYWGDIFFGIDSNTRQGRNILGRLLMEYRDSL